MFLGFPCDVRSFSCEGAGWVARDPVRSGRSRPASPRPLQHPGLMGAWQLLLVGVVLLLGLCGVLIPGVPGSWLVWAGVAWVAPGGGRPTPWWLAVAGVGHERT